MRSLRRGLALSILSLTMALEPTDSTRAAFLEGKTLTHFVIYGTTFDDLTRRPFEFTVGPWVEWEEGAPVRFDQSRTYDFSDTQLSIAFPNQITWTPAPLNGSRFVDTEGSIAAFGSVSVNPAGTNVDFDASRIIVDEDSIFLNYQGLTFPADSRLLLDLTPVPEPSCSFGSGAKSLRQPRPGRAAMSKAGGLRCVVAGMDRA